MRTRLFISILILSIKGINAYGQSPTDADILYDFRLDKAWYMKEMSSFLDTSFLNRFENDICLYEKQDSADGIKEGQILFVGSSTIRKWNNLRKDMYPLSVMNRGFGGSTFPELLYYYDRLVLKYKPSKIVLYEGDNDITASFLTPETVFKCFKWFVQLTENYLPGTPVYFVSIKLSPAREKFMDKLLITNMMIEEYCRIRPNVYFIDITGNMYDDYGNIRTDIFLSDKLHLNEKGYQLWTDIIKNALLTH
jgi:lysophospholipase L1-like esterase